MPQAKSAVLVAIDAQLDTLKNREHELLHEVDQLLQKKTECLDEKLAQLNQCIGYFRFIHFCLMFCKNFRNWQIDVE